MSDLPLCQEWITRENYPELAARIEAIRQKIYADYPNDIPAPACVYDYSPTTFETLVSDADDVRNRAENNAFYYPEHDGVPEHIAFGRHFLASHTVEAIAAIYAHEAGHDIFDHPWASTLRETLRVNECKADHFSEKYAPGGMAAWLAERPAETVRDYATKTHPYNTERLAALIDPVAKNAPVYGIIFKDHCAFELPAAPPLIAESSPGGTAVKALP